MGVPAAGRRWYGAGVAAPVVAHRAARLAAALLAAIVLVTGCAGTDVPEPLAGLPVVTVGAGARELRLAVAADHRRGLADVDGLGALDGMLFDLGREVAPEAYPFWMAGVRFPLELAFVAADGRIVDRVVLAACPDRTGCPRHVAAAPFRWVVEVPPDTLGDAERLALPGVPTSFVPSSVR